MLDSRFRKTAKPARLGRRKRRLFYIKSTLAIVAIALVLTGVVFLSRAPGLQIKDVAVSGNSTAVKEDLIEKATELGEGSLLWLFPRTNVALYPRAALAGALLSEFPQLKTAEVNTDGLTTLTIDVTERAPAGLWCGRDVGQSGNCLFLDDSGYIYGRAPSFTGPVYIRYYGLSTEGEALRSQYVPENTFRTLALFFTSLRKLNLTADAFSILNAYVEAACLEIMEVGR